MNNTFGSDVADWAKKTQEKQADVLHESVRLTVVEATKPEDSGGHMPVISGNLRNSVAVSTTGPVKLNFVTKKFRNPVDAVNNAIAGIEVGEKAYIGFQAPYAHKIEAAKGFLRLAAQRWPLIVKEAVKKLG